MKFREIFRFEFAYQVRRVSTWVFFPVLVVVAFLMMSESFSDARSREYFLNAPWLVAGVTVFPPGSLLWLLATAAVSGDVATRDVRTRMHPLTYTVRVSKTDHLGGRFLAAFVLNALILLALPAGSLLAALSAGVDAGIPGPFRPAAYLGAYVFLALPNAFIATAIQFSLAALSRRANAGYLGGVLIFAVMASSAFLAEDLGLWELAKLVDPLGIVFVIEVSRVWTPIEMNTRLIALDGSLLANRLIWLGVALGILAFTYRRFRFDHPVERSPFDSLRSLRAGRRIRTRALAHSPAPVETGIVRSTPISVPQILRTFGFATHVHQTFAVVRASFRTIAMSRSGFVLSLAVAMFAGLIMLDQMRFLGIPLLPRTDHVLTILTTPVAGPGPWMTIPLLTVFWSGELIWREREARLSEMVDAAPVPEWVLFLGKFLGLGLVLVACTALLMTVGMLVQMRWGYHDFEIGPYLRILFGLQLADYLLFALLTLVVHVQVNQKHVANLVALIAWAYTGGFHVALGIEHNLLVYGSDPGWSYTDMRGFGPFLGPWLWFKLYWAAWALLLAVAARLLWARGRERGLGVRFRMARARFTPPTAWAAAAAVALIVTVGGFIFYNTNMLNAYATASDRMERRAEYERRYGQYERLPQPQLTGINLHVEIYPDRREVEIRGTYQLVNNSGAGIDAIHVATASGVETGEVGFDRPAARVLADDDLGHRIYVLEKPLQPDDALRLDFEVQFRPRGFGNSGIDASVVANGTYFTNLNWLPAIGHQSNRELSTAGDRRAHGLGPRPEVPSLYDSEARRERPNAGRIAFDAVVGTDEDQIAVAPGALQRTWTESGRRYFHYVTDAPIGNEYALFSADYAVREDRWNDITIQIFHHPRHTENLERMVRSVQASLRYYTEQFGPYPYRHIRIVEYPGHSRGMHADANTITYQEGFSLLNPRVDRGDLDLPFYVVAHEVAHQWWGTQVAPAYVEGAGLLVESLATYSAMRVLEETLGPEHLRRYLRFARAEYDIPRTRAAPPLLQATDAFLFYRKGPLALYALSEYIGEERVHEALRRLLEKHGSGTPPLPTSLDLYRELQAVTPDSLQYLLHDLFEANTFWELETERATAEQTEAGTWQVTLGVQARKVVVDSAGVETEVPMDDSVQVGVFAPAEAGERSGKPLYLQMQRIRSGKQTITVTVPRQPTRAGIDPNHLLIDLKTDDNIKTVKIQN